jgi:hypothetical protein
MSHPPYLLPWVRILFLDPLDHVDDVGSRDVAVRTAAAAPGVDDAAADRTGWVVELAAYLSRYRRESVT